MTDARFSRSYILFILCAIFLSSARAATPPVPDSLRDRDFMPGVAGDPSKPMWSGTSWNDSAYSTGASALHALGITGKGVTAAVYDTPFDIGHERLRDNIVGTCGITALVVGSNDLEPFTGSLDGYRYLRRHEEDGVSYDLYISERADSVALTPTTRYQTRTHHHGTHVAGSIVGMAPDAGLFLLNGASINTANNTLDALMFDGDLMRVAAKLADKYNIFAFNGSYGDVEIWFTADKQKDADLHDPYSAAGLAAMRSSGILPFLCSHNNGWNNFTTPPAAATDAIAVGALQAWGLVTSFSNQSAKVVLVAPGQDIYSSIPSWAQGNRTGIAGYNLMDGTSMATPHVTGAAVLLKSGARNATAEQIYEALVVTGDRIVYDGDMLLHKSFMPVDDLGMPEWDTLDSWREFMARRTGAAYGIGFDPDWAAPLEQTEYRFIRVDKAYRYLTGMRTLGLMMEADATGSPYAGMLGSFAGELGKNLNKTTADLYQRLDGQAPGVLARAARQLSPAFARNTLESATLGHLDLHGAIGRRLRTGRFLAAPAEQAGIASTDGNACLPPPAPRHGVTTWAEGFGGHAHRSESLEASKYNGHFAGALVGVEAARGDECRIGGFAAWTNHAIRGDGRSKGNWGTVGMYFGAERDGFSCDLSASAGLGDYDLRRGVYGPLAVFPGFVYAPMQVHAGSDTRAFAATARLGAAYEVELGGWRFGPSVEGSLSHIAMRAYRETGADGLNLRVKRHAYTYGEAGAGLQAARAFRLAGRPFAASARVLALYGRSDAQALRGEFTTGGTPFKATPKRLSGMWCVPEASLTWQATERVTLSASYQGRFGERTSVNTGFLSVGVSW